MNIQEGTMVKAEMNYPPITIGGVVTHTKEIEIQEQKIFMVKVIFQDEAKTRGTYAFYPNTYNKNQTEQDVVLISGNNSCPDKISVVQ